MRAAETVTINNRTRTYAERSSDLGPLHISKAGGAITLDDAPDGGTVHTGGGNIVIESAGGKLTATTGGGDIEIRRVTGSARVSTGAGDVHITVVDDDGREHTIEATSGHGTIELVLPRSLDARVELETAYTEGFGHVATRIDSDWTLERSGIERNGRARTAERRGSSSGRQASSGADVASFAWHVNGDVIVRRSASLGYPRFPISRFPIPDSR